MARQLRVEYPGALDHITARGNDPTRALIPSTMIWSRT